MISISSSLAERVQMVNKNAPCSENKSIPFSELKKIFLSANEKSFGEQTDISKDQPLAGNKMERSVWGGEFSETLTISLNKFNF